MPEKLLSFLFSLSKLANPVKMFCDKIVRFCSHETIVKTKDDNLKANRQFTRDVISHRDELRIQLEETKKERNFFKEGAKLLKAEINNRDNSLNKFADIVERQTNKIHNMIKKVERFYLYKMFIRLFAIRFGMIDSKRLALIESATMDMLTDEEVQEWLDIMLKISGLATENQARPLVALQFLMEAKVSAISPTKP